MSDNEFQEKFVDPNTGETVTRKKIPEGMTAEIEKFVNLNAQHASNFMQLSKNVVGLTKKMNQEFDNANNAEQAIGKEVLRLREKLGCTSEWIYNIPMKCMEKREPPADTRMLSEGVKSESR